MINRIANREKAKRDEVLRKGSKRDDGTMGQRGRNEKRFDGSSGEGSEKKKDNGEKKRRVGDERVKRRITSKEGRKRQMRRISVK